MRALHIFSLVFVGLSLAASAQAAERRSGSYDVAIPRSRIETAQVEPMSAPHVPEELDFGMSSWAPKSFALPARISSATTFERAGLPSIYVNYLMAPFTVDGLFAKMGLNWMALNRSGTVGDESSMVRQDQTVQLMSVRLGAEYSPDRMQFYGAHPYVGAALLPTFGMTGRTAFDEGSVYFGVPVEWSLGSKFELTRMGISWNHAYFDLGVSGTAGTVDHSTVAGMGVKGGLRVTL
jgi:hypothetical protein